MSSKNNTPDIKLNLIRQEILEKDYKRKIETSFYDIKRVSKVR